LISSGPARTPIGAGRENSNAPVTVHPFRDGAGRSQSPDPRPFAGPQLAGEAPSIRGHRRRPLSPLCSAGDRDRRHLNSSAPSGVRVRVPAPASAWTSGSGRSADDVAQRQERVGVTRGVTRSPRSARRAGGRFPRAKAARPTSTPSSAAGSISTLPLRRPQRRGGRCSPSPGRGGSRACGRRR
jgi:hypothetical protein